MHHGFQWSGSVGWLTAVSLSQAKSNFLDINMPRLGGVQCLKELKRKECYKIFQWLFIQQAG
jgi:CheY-like chemotaxis protein